MSSKGITVRIDRLNAIRILGASMRDKQAQFERDKAGYAARLKRGRAAVLTKLAKLGREARAGNIQSLRKIAHDSPMDWHTMNTLLPEPPSLNLCEEKQLLLMLQNDVRKIVPINSNHQLWAILQGKCEPLA